ncbi:MAG: hypothetical protein VW268_07370 [Rhodospirillaceae bacterium]
MLKFSSAPRQGLKYVNFVVRRDWIGQLLPVIDLFLGDKDGDMAAQCALVIQNVAFEFPIFREHGRQRGGLGFGLGADVDRRRFQKNATVDW